MSMSPEDRQQAIERAGAALRAGGVVVLPTETVYGVFTSATPDGARALDLATGEPQGDHEPRFTLHLADPDVLARRLELESPVARRLLHRLAPGPARVVIEQPESAIARFCSALGIERGLVDNGSAIAVRIPDHPIARAVIRAAGGTSLARALGASRWGVEGDPGADLSRIGGFEGEDAPTMVIDDGPTLHGCASTTVSIGSQGRFDVREGGPIPEERVLAMLNTHVLFVCTGNTCRSPMAEAIARDLVAKLPPSGISVSVSSAGVAAGEGHRASPEAVEVLGERGIDLAGHKSTALTPELVDRADVIYTMTPTHAQAVMQMAPASVHKVFPIDPVHPVGDPIGCPVEVYREVADQLEKLIGERLKEIVV